MQKRDAKQRNRLGDSSADYSADQNVELIPYSPYLSRWCSRKVLGGSLITALFQLADKSADKSQPLVIINLLSVKVQIVSTILIIFYYLKKLYKTQELQA